MLRALNRVRPLAKGSSLGSGAMSPARWLSATAVEREKMYYDVVTVGAGPAGLSAAIRLNGNVFEPRALKELFPDESYLQDSELFHTPVKEDKFLWLLENGSSVNIPYALMPQELHNQMTRYLAAKAEELGVEIYPGFAADGLLYSEDGKTDAGISKSGEVKETFAQGIELRGRQALARRSSSTSLTCETAETCSFLYHMAPNLVLVGMVTGLDYANPFINPYKVSGFHSIPNTAVPGALLLGCSAGFLNSVKIKGSHLAMKSGMLAAEALAPLLAENKPEEYSDAAQPMPVYAPGYEKDWRESWMGKELEKIRNVQQSFHSPLGTIGGMAYTAATCFVTKGKEPWTFQNKVEDFQKTGAGKDHQAIDYPKPDNKISFDLLTNLSRSGTNHEEDQPAHLRVRPGSEQLIHQSFHHHAAPETRFCPAGVYEYHTPEDTHQSPKLVINAQNCVHCKCCAVKMPGAYIKWTVPEGGGGPKYTLM
eukprot:gene29034-35045_t